MSRESLLSAIRELTTYVGHPGPVVGLDAVLEVVAEHLPEAPAGPVDVEATAERDTLLGELGAAHRYLEEHARDIAGLRNELAAMTRQRDAARGEADRLRHGEDIEGDHVCPGDLRADRLRAEIAAALDAEADRLLPQRHPGHCPDRVYTLDAREGLHAFAARLRAGEEAAP